MLVPGTCDVRNNHLIAGYRSRIILTVMFKTPVTRLILSFASLSILSAFAQAGPLGPAAGYNMFIKNNYSAMYSDIEGKAAVGGNWDTSGYSVGALLTGPTQDALIVGGNVKFNGGSVQGNIVAGGSANLTSFGFNNGGKLKSGSQIDFDSAFNQLSASSASWFNLTSTGTITKPWSTLNFKGTNNGLNVFNISSDNLWNASDVQFDVPAGATVLVNVTGKNVKFKGYGYGLNGLARENLLWNTSEATTVDYNYLEGSLLAANADITTNWGVIQGQVIGKSFNGPSQTNLHLFNGELPPVAPVPEPASMIALGMGALALVRRKKAAK